MSPPTFAYEFAGSFGLETEFSDNINLTKDKQSDLVTELFIGFSYQDRSPTIEGLVAGRLGYRTFLHGNAADELRPNIRGNLLFHLRPERFSWALDGAWEQLRTEPLGPEAPGNLENQFVLSTGPDVRLPLTATTSFTAGARAGYAATYASDSSANADNSNTSYRATLGLVEELGATETAAAYLTSRAVRYDDDDLGGASADFNVIDMSLAYDSRTPLGDTTIEIGASYLDQQGSDRGAVFLLRADASRRLTPLTRGGVRLNFGYNDQSNATLTAPLSAELGAVGLGNSAESASTGPFYQRRAEAFLERVGGQSRLVGSLYANSQDYVAGSTEDQLYYGASIAWSRRLSRVTDFLVSGTAERRDLSSGDEYSQNYAATAQLTRRLSRNVFANVRLRHQRGTGSTETSEYDESAVLFGIRYEFGTSPFQPTGS
ncbi:hypothetical protein [Thiococcus pfennigii]|nr:hypothetical protein [Thiococcus pfennigii]